MRAKIIIVFHFFLSSLRNTLMIIILSSQIHTDTDRIFEEQKCGLNKLISIMMGKDNSANRFLGEIAGEALTHVVGVMMRYGRCRVRGAKLLIGILK